MYLIGTLKWVTEVEGNSAVHLTPQAGKPILSSYMCWVISIIIVVAVNAGTTTRLAYNGA